MIKSKIEGMQLKLGHSKCFQMHVGRSKNTCPTLSIHGKEMLKTEKEKYLGNILTSNVKLDENIVERVNKGFGLIHSFFL